MKDPYLLKEYIYDRSFGRLRNFEMKFIKNPSTMFLFLFLTFIHYKFC